MAGDVFSRLRAAIEKFNRAAGTGAPSRKGPAVPPGFVRVTLLDDSKAGAKGLDRLFDAFDTTIREVPDVLRDAVPTIRAAHAAVFTTEGSAGRGPWAQLAPRTLRERQLLGYGPGPILVRSGALKAHVLSTPAKIRRRGNLVELRIEPDPVVDGVKKYRALAKGNPATNLPGRPMVAVGPAEAVKITSAIQRGLRARAAKNGLRA